MKPKRHKVECLACGAVFNNDYKKTHESNKHQGQNVRVKMVGAPENPFALAASKKRKIDPEITSDDVTGDATVSTRVPIREPSIDIPSTITAENIPLEIIEVSAVPIEVLPISGSCEESLLDNDVIPVEEDEVAPSITKTETADETEAVEPMIDIEQISDSELLGEAPPVSFEQCVGTFACLVDTIASCKSILETMKTNKIVDNHATILKIMDSVDLVKHACEDTSNICKQFDKIMKERNEKLTFDEDENKTFEIVDHDPGLRKDLHTDNERRYLISLGPHQPVLARFPSDGKNRFNPNWYRDYNFLEYSTYKDAAFCFVCFLFPSGTGKEKSEVAWSKKGVKGWGKMESKGKGEKGKLETHFSSIAHKCAMSDYAHFLREKNHVDKLLGHDAMNALIEERKSQKLQ